MDKSFDPKSIEQTQYDRWEAANIFAPPATGEANYCILLPPPNVTGTLHMGHAFQHTLMDTLIRYRRMHGDRTLWQGGTDHAGIASRWWWSASWAPTARAATTSGARTS